MTRILDWIIPGDALRWGRLTAGWRVTGRYGNLRVTIDPGRHASGILRAQRAIVRREAAAAESARLEAAKAIDPRDPACVERWPECVDGEYNPACCRWPKSCSCEIREAR